MSAPYIVKMFTKNRLEDLVVALTEFKGHHLCDIRIYADSSGFDGEKFATKKGICIQVGLISKLVEALEDARAEARRRGLLPEEGEPTN